MDAGAEDDGSGGSTSGDRVLRTCLTWEVEGGADVSTAIDDVAPSRVAFSLDEGRMKAGVVLEETASPTRSRVASNEGPPAEGR